MCVAVQSKSEYVWVCISLALCMWSHPPNLTFFFHSRYGGISVGAINSQVPQSETEINSSIDLGTFQVCDKYFHLNRSEAFAKTPQVFSIKKNQKNKFTSVLFWNLIYEKCGQCKTCCLKPQTQFLRKNNPYYGNRSLKLDNISVSIPTFLNDILMLFCLLCSLLDSQGVSVCQLNQSVGCFTTLAQTKISKQVVKKMFHL